MDSTPPMNGGNASLHQQACPTGSVHKSDLTLEFDLCVYNVSDRAQDYWNDEIPADRDSRLWQIQIDMRSGTNILRGNQIRNWNAFIASERQTGGTNTLDNATLDKVQMLQAFGSGNCGPGSMGFV